MAVRSTPGAGSEQRRKCPANASGWLFSLFRYTYIHIHMCVLFLEGFSISTAVLSFPTYDPTYRFGSLLDLFSSFTFFVHRIIPEARTRCLIYLIRLFVLIHVIPSTMPPPTYTI